MKDLLFFRLCDVAPYLAKEIILAAAELRSKGRHINIDGHDKQRKLQMMERVCVGLRPSCLLWAALALPGRLSGCRSGGTAAWYRRSCCPSTAAARGTARTPTCRQILRYSILQFGVSIGNNIYLFYESFKNCSLGSLQQGDDLIQENQVRCKVGSEQEGTRDTFCRAAGEALKIEQLYCYCAIPTIFTWEPVFDCDPLWLILCNVSRNIAFLHLSSLASVTLFCRK